MAFTPGPWEVDEDAMQVHAGDGEVCEMGTYGEIKPWRGYFNRRANARLIAAAPEMHAALEAIVGEAAFEGLPECKQEAILAALSKAVT